MKCTALLLALTSFAIGCMVGDGGVNDNDFAIQSGGADPAKDWNLFAEQAAIAQPHPPPVAALDMAITQVAIYDAVLSYDQRYKPYHAIVQNARGSQIAAGAKAGHDILVYLFPSQSATIDAEYAGYLSQYGISATDPGVSVGAKAAAAIIALRSNDGRFPANPPPFLGGTAVGQWRPTPSLLPGPPASNAPGLTPWVADVTPFTDGAREVYAPPVPSFGSSTWESDYNEVASYGSLTSTVRTADQTQTALWWNDNGPLLWQRALRDLASRQTRVVDSARMFALTDIALADTQINTWAIKYKTVRWRPITAIRLGDTDGNDHTVADPNWQPLINTPNFPSYTSGHASTSAAACTALRLIFGSDSTSFTITSNNPQVTNKVRTFTSFKAAISSVVDARVWSGIHYRSDDVVGATMGTQIATNVFNDYLKRD